MAQTPDDMASARAQARAAIQTNIRAQSSLGSGAPPSKPGNTYSPYARPTLPPGNSLEDDGNRRTNIYMRGPDGKLQFTPDYAKRVEGIRVDWRGVAADLASIGAASASLAFAPAGAGSVAGFLRRPRVGQTVYRVYGDKAQAYGPSWSRRNPETVKNYRDVAGLPNENTGRFVLQGKLRDVKDVRVTRATELDGNRGGIDELKIRSPDDKIDLQGVWGKNPEF